jgi:hypothetical protein
MLSQAVGWTGGLNRDEPPEFGEWLADILEACFNELVK